LALTATAILLRRVEAEGHDDVWVVQRCDGSRYTVEAFEAARIVGNVGWQHLERDVAPES
jgi:hypothetical protein